MTLVCPTKAPILAALSPYFPSVPLLFPPVRLFPLHLPPESPPAFFLFLFPPAFPHGLLFLLISPLPPAFPVSSLGSPSYLPPVLSCVSLTTPPAWIYL
ncbi:hypothetical protein E2C01_008078 [Portunus trituberculatus]|uniref:Uncharacterized protein n=1 Tax=Portunus trituberculatus TaxID=210409 RepID=A0A5B7D252_PORTR|nr:hypothetical protein [Portunus trituberculatus]